MPTNSTSIGEESGALKSRRISFARLARTLPVRTTGFFTSLRRWTRRSGRASQSGRLPGVHVEPLTSSVPVAAPGEKSYWESRFYLAPESVE